MHIVVNDIDTSPTRLAYQPGGKRGLTPTGDLDEQKQPTQRLGRRG
ncbi:hypothetical protein [Ewingella americana]